MPVPYEPVVRHAWGPGDVVCAPCHAQLPAGACDDEGCACVCRDAEVIPVFHIPEDYGDRDPLPPATLSGMWVEPTALPEPLTTWVAPIDRVDHERAEKYVTGWGPAVALIVVLAQVLTLTLVLTTDTDDTWAEPLVVFTCILTASYVFVLGIIRPKSWLPHSEGESS